MAKYLFQASYTLEGVRGLMKEGASARAKAIDGLIASVGGTTEACYFSFGGKDLYCVADLPNDEAAAAVSLAAASGGGLSISTTVLIEPATMDAAVKKPVDYTPPRA